MNKLSLTSWTGLDPLKPTYALAAGVDLVVIRWPDEEQASVLYGRCAHRGALMSDGRIEGGNIVCGVHDWDYCYKSGVSSYDPAEKLHRFNAWVEDDQVWVDEDEIRAWAVDNPQPYDRDAYQGLYKDLHGGAALQIYPAPGRARPRKGGTPWPGQRHGRSPRRVAQMGANPAPDRPAAQGPDVG